MLTDLFLRAIQLDASDIHLSANLPPLIRLQGEIRSLNHEPLNPTQLEKALLTLLSKREQQEFKEQGELDFATTFQHHRFRVNLFRQARGISATLRIIQDKIPTLEAIHAPKIFEQLTTLREGLILVTGPTGSGKSTTLAAMIEKINCTASKHILTIEDPIEFLYSPKRSLIQQRELHRDTRSFSTALKSALRADPDIILIGELRDLETVELALTAAETGHLVFATLHTASAAQTIDRIIDLFPAEKTKQIRTMLSESLRAIISQRLIKTESNRQAIWEILLTTPAVKNLIRKQEVAQINNAIQMGSEVGMQTFLQQIEKLENSGILSPLFAKKAREQINPVLYS